MMAQALGPLLLMWDTKVDVWTPGFSSAYPRPIPTLSPGVASIWGVNQQMETLSLSVLLSKYDFLLKVNKYNFKKKVTALLLFYILSLPVYNTLQNYESLLFSILKKKDS